MNVIPMRYSEMVCTPEGQTLFTLEWICTDGAGYHTYILRCGDINTGNTLKLNRLTDQNVYDIMRDMYGTYKKYLVNTRLQ